MFPCLTSLICGAIAIAIRRDSNTHLETFADHSDIFYSDISNEIPVIPKLYPKLQYFMSKMLVIVKWIIRESKNPENKYLITPKDACLYLDTMYYNNTLNTHGCVKTFKHHLQNDT